jgi:RimJ/RimL family protein N-acetyltransferase
MDPGHPVSEFRVRERTIVLRVPEHDDATEFVRFTNALASEKRTNLDLAIISPDQEITMAEAERLVERMLKALESDDAVFVWGFDGKTLVGTCDILRPHFAELRHTGLLDIGILADFRGVGLGEAMVSSAVEAARSLGIWLVELRVFSTNSAAIKLYERIGFKRSGTTPNMIMKNGKYIDDVQMYIDLRGIVH